MSHGQNEWRPSRTRNERQSDAMQKLGSSTKQMQGSENERESALRPKAHTPQPQRHIAPNRPPSVVNMKREPGPRRRVGSVYYVRFSRDVRWSSISGEEYLLGRWVCYAWVQIAECTMGEDDRLLKG